MPPIPQFHDSSYRLLYDHVRMVRDLLVGFLPPDVVTFLDLSSLEQMPTEYVGDRLRQSRGDKVWRIRIASRGGAPPRDEWLYLLVLLEFQSTTDWFMAARVLGYTAEAHIQLIRGGTVPEGGRLPPVLPIVIYNGRTRWSAPVEVGELIAGIDEVLLPYQPRQRYFVIDEQALEVEDLPPDNVVSAHIALEQGSLATVGSVLGDLARLLPGEGDAGLRRAFATWVLGMAEHGSRFAIGPQMMGRLRAFEEKGDLREMGSLLAERFDEYVDEQVAKGVAKGREEGLEERGRALLLSVASRRYGARIAAELALLLAPGDDPNRIEEIFAEMFECPDGAEFLARVRRPD